MSNPIPKGTPVDGDMTAALDPRFLNALVLQGALEKTGKPELEVTMDRVEFHESLKYENGQTDADVYLLYFKGTDKPLKLNATNIKAIISHHGTIGKGWNGKKIALHIGTARRPDLGGAMGPCVRIRPKIGAPVDPFKGGKVQAQKPALGKGENKGGDLF